MSVLVDTNVLLSSVNPVDPQSSLASHALEALQLRNERLCVAPQNLIEFWAVATRPHNVNGLGMTANQANAELSKLRAFLRLLPSTLAVFDEWQKLVSAYGIAGKQTHDAHIAAFMRVHAITDILTFDTGHFARFPSISVLHPAHV